MMRLSLLFLIAVCANAQFFPFPGPGTIAHSGGGGGGSHALTFRGESHANPSGSLNSATTPGSLSISSGDLIVLTVSYDNSGDAVTATCGSNTLTSAVTNTDGGGYFVQTFYLQNATAATTTCTANFGGTQRQFVSIAAANWGGVATSGGVLNQSCNSSGCSGLPTSSTNRTAQNVTTTTADVALIATGVDWNGGISYTGANGFTIRENPSAAGSTPFLADRAVSAAGSYPGGNFATAASSGQYLSNFLVFALQ